MYDESEIILLNVGGMRFETLKETISYIPGTNLSCQKFLQQHYRPEHNEYFFDRSPFIFEFILNYYRLGELHIPDYICSTALQKELDFWGINASDMNGCCWLNYNSRCHTNKTLKKFEEKKMRKAEEFEEERKVMALKQTNIWRKLRPKIWRFLEDPASTRLASAYGILSFCVIMLAVTSFCIQTTPPYTDVLVEVNNSSEKKNEDFLSHRYSKTLHSIDLGCLAFFASETILRFVMCPSKLKFFTSILNIFDILSILSFILEEVLKKYTNTNTKSLQGIITIVYMMRILRAFRVFRLAQHNKGLRVLIYTIKASISEIILIMIIISLGILLFAAVIYYVEFRTNKFNLGIPNCFWWAIITMTTVGYGDMYPETAVGKVIGAICSLCGIMLISFTVPIIVNNFEIFYAQVQYGKEFDSHLQQVVTWRRAVGKLKKSKLTLKKLNGINKVQESSLASDTDLTESNKMTEVEPVIDDEKNTEYNHVQNNVSGIP